MPHSQQGPLVPTSKGALPKMCLFPYLMVIETLRIWSSKLIRLFEILDFG